VFTGNECLQEKNHESYLAGAVGAAFGFEEATDEKQGTENIQSCSLLRPISQPNEKQPQCPPDNSACPIPETYCVHSFDND
jgi:hypothetical protein